MLKAAVAQSGAKRILIPFDHCDNIVVGVRDAGMKALVTEAVSVLMEFVKDREGCPARPAVP